MSDEYGHRMLRSGGRVRTVATALAVAWATLAALAGCGGDATERSASSSNADLVQQWWRWVGGMSEQDDPMHDTVGTSCELDQAEDGVWFLAGTYDSVVERSCRVPAGRPMLIPVMAKICDVSEGEQCTVDPVYEQSATLDDNPVTMQRVHVGSPFAIGVRKGNPISPGGGIAKVRSDGIWVRLAPPAVGRHELVVKGEAADFSIAVTYHLDIVQE